MRWVKVSAEDVSGIFYDENLHSLKIKFSDGSKGLANGVTPIRYAEFVAIAPRDQTTYYRNMIAPFIVRRSGGSKPLRRVAMASAKILGAIVVACLLFQMIDLIRLRGA